jgi:hypothetical protein
MPFFNLVQFGLGLLSVSPEVRMRTGEGFIAFVQAGVGIADLVFAILIAQGVMRQSAVLPWSLDRCDHVNEWATAADGRHYFIEACALRNLRANFEPTTLCRSMIFNMDMAAMLAYVIFCLVPYLAAFWPYRVTNL